MSHRLTALLLAFVLAVAACGGGDDSTDPADDTTEATDDAAEGGGGEEVDGTDADDVSDSDGMTEADDVSDSDGMTEADEPVELTASFRGVTETEIHIGVGLVDATDFGFNRGDVPAKWQAVIDEVNEGGGILGRMIVPHFESYLPVGSTEADAACARLVEDLEVFAFVGEARDGNELCYTELNDTIVVNVFPVLEESIERSNGLLFSTQSSPAGDQTRAVEVFAGERLIEGAVVHIHSVQSEESLVAPAADAIEANGGRVSNTTVASADQGDIPAAESEIDTIVQRAIADGATAIYAVASAGGAVTGGVERAGADLTVFTTAASAANFLNFGYDPGAIDLVAAGGESLEDAAARGDAELLECVARFEATSGETVNIGIEDPDPDNLPATTRACKAIDLFVIIATAAGPDLTNDSFRDAAAGLGRFELFGASAASLGADKFSADDSPPMVLRWDAATQSFTPK